ncbi:hypothetical protein RUM43_003573 [Polyplax serrata]|uniref:Uncharacterized protein n=1 Tax=Polyplax serrata TaxID=468196 RepID=A0AAN8P3E4_POLSC
MSLIVFNIYLRDLKHHSDSLSVNSQNETSRSCRQQREGGRTINTIYSSKTKSPYPRKADDTWGEIFFKSMPLPPLFLPDCQIMQCLTDLQHSAGIEDIV